MSTPTSNRKYPDRMTRVRGGMFDDVCLYNGFYIPDDKIDLICEWLTGYAEALDMIDRANGSEPDPKKSKQAKIRSFMRAVSEGRKNDNMNFAQCTVDEIDRSLAEFRASSAKEGTLIGNLEDRQRENIARTGSRSEALDKEIEEAKERKAKDDKEIRGLEEMRERAFVKKDEETK